MGNFSELSGVIQKDQIPPFAISKIFEKGATFQHYFYDEFTYKNPATDLPLKYFFGNNSQTALPSAFVNNPHGLIGGHIGFVNGGGINSEIIMRPGVGNLGPPLLTGLVNRKSEMRVMITFAGDVTSRQTGSEWSIGMTYNGIAPSFSAGHINDLFGVNFVCRDPGFGSTPVSGRIFAISNGGIGLIATDTGVQQPTQTSGKLMELCIVNNKTSIQYFIDNALVATHSSANITGDGRGRPLIYMFDASGGVPANSFALDSWLIWQEAQ